LKNNSRLFLNFFKYKSNHQRYLLMQNWRHLSRRFWTLRKFQPLCISLGHTTCQYRSSNLLIFKISAHRDYWSTWYFTTLS
jgi:hypothetical protein